MYANCFHAELLHLKTFRHFAYSYFLVSLLLRTFQANSDINELLLMQILRSHLHLQINFILSSWDGTKRRRRSSSRSKRSTTSPFDDLVRLSGGSLIRISKANMKSATDVIVGIGTRTYPVRFSVIVYLQFDAPQFFLRCLYFARPIINRKMPIKNQRQFG